MIRHGEEPMIEVSEKPNLPSAEETARTTAIVIYLLYLAALINGLTAIIGVVLAYVKRDDVRGTIYEGHFSNAIEIFWVFLIGMCVAVPLCFVLVGIPLVILLYVWVLFRTIKGLVRAIDAKPYL
jgi:uncharacterized membrane protein